MAIESLADYDFTAGREPDSHLEPIFLLESWLAYQRHEFIRELRDLDPAQPASWSIGHDDYAGGSADGQAHMLRFAALREIIR